MVGVVVAVGLLYIFFSLRICHRCPSSFLSLLICPYHQVILPVVFFYEMMLVIGLMLLLLSLLMLLSFLLLLSLLLLLSSLLPLLMLLLL